MGDRLGTPRVVDNNLFYSFCLLFCFFFFKKSSDTASPCTTAMVSVRRGGPPCAQPPMPMADDLSYRFSLRRNVRTSESSKTFKTENELWGLAFVLLLDVYAKLWTQGSFLFSKSYTNINSSERPYKTEPKTFFTWNLAIEGFARVDFSMLISNLSFINEREK